MPHWESAQARCVCVWGGGSAWLVPTGSSVPAPQCAVTLADGVGEPVQEGEGQGGGTSSHLVLRLSLIFVGVEASPPGESPAPEPGI